MITDESLGVTARFTTAGGTALAQRSNNLTIKDTSYGPQTYDVYIDSNRGGPNTIIEGQVTKGPTTLQQLMEEQHPGVTRRDGDIFNIHVAPEIFIIGSPQLARLSPRASEYAARGVYLNAGDAIYSRLTQALSGGEGVDDTHMVYSYYLDHSKGDYYSRTYDQTVDLQGCYGSVRMFTWCLHAASANVRFILYNADGSVAGDYTTITGNNKSNTQNINIGKGMYGRLIYTYNKANSPDSKNNTFFVFKLVNMNASSCPALLISKKYFNETNTINIYNNGKILGAGGDGHNHTPPKYSHDWWNKESPPVVPDAISRSQTGGDAIQCTDVAALNIYNNGVISGGGGGAHMIQKSHPYASSASVMEPLNGGAPLGRGGVTWSAFFGGGTYEDPILYGVDASLMSPVGAHGGAWGKGGRSPENSGYYDFPPGFYYRGRPNQVNYYGSGQYLGLHPNATAIPY